MVTIEIAPAKFNRYLSVLGRRRDGFHLLELVTTVLHGWQALTDELTVEIADELSLEIEGPESNGLIPDESNLVIKAWRALEKESGKVLPAKINLYKRIPFGAGLGGGSSDAAAALRAGNSIYELGLPSATLLRLAADLGSDVPLFLLGGTVHGKDLGQKVSKIKDFPLPPMLIAFPHIHLSTTSVYKAVSLTDNINPAHCPALEIGEVPPWRNDLTRAALKICPALGPVRDVLQNVGGDPLLCGSGSSWAAKFPSIADRDSALEGLLAWHPEWSIYTE
ncbi:MAG: 4-(cytidine 5'-diphospho)-2-C-methyl-D-erythritol kinase [Holophagaceae bacterium]|nr:4-(cytidine 5'-diphospho)-2-C-methyl-D-erythritol kinase [Holophagaceae bacterium]